MFEIKRFIDDCRAALKEAEAPKAVREVVAHAIADPAAILKALGEPTCGGVKRLYPAPDLPIINPIWPARMTLVPHNHNMWAVIGVYTGREDNIFWRRLKGDPAGHIEAAAAAGRKAPYGKLIPPNASIAIGAQRTVSSSNRR